MVGHSSLFSNVHDGTDDEQQASHQERDVDALLQHLDVAISPLVDLARVEDRAEEPQDGACDKRVQRMLLQLEVPVSFLLLICT